MKRDDLIAELKKLPEGPGIMIGSKQYHFARKACLKKVALIKTTYHAGGPLWMDYEEAKEIEWKQWGKILETKQIISIGG